MQESRQALSNKGVYFWETGTQTGYSRYKGNDKTKTGHKTGT